MTNKPKKVGEILVAAGIIDEMQLNAALGEQARWGDRLGIPLVKMGMVKEGHLIRALAKQLDLPVASLAGKRITEAVLALVPGRVASEHGVIPLFTKQKGSIQQRSPSERASRASALRNRRPLAHRPVHPPPTS